MIPTNLKLEQNGFSSFHQISQRTKNHVTQSIKLARTHKEQNNHFFL